MIEMWDEFKPLTKKFEEEKTMREITEELGTQHEERTIRYMKEATNVLPYIEGIEVNKIYAYNPLYGDDRKCTCGHTYYRHFDSYEDMENCGCKYCGCSTFQEKN